MSGRSWLAAGLIALALLAPVRGRAEEPPYLVKDIFPGRDPNAKSHPGGFVVLGDVVLFSADDGEHGYELWRTDGSAEGTVLVKDIAPGPTSGLSVGASIIPISTDVAVFAAFDADHGLELWRSDGTADGTMLIKDINPGSASSVYYSWLFFWNDTVYFSATDEATGAELWRTDGTPSGTIQVADINPGPASSTPGGFTASGDTLFFVADDGVHGCELWGTDGTTAGTRLVKDTDPAVQCDVALDHWPGQIHVAPTSLTDVDGTLFFSTDTALWRSDGTEAGTVPLRSFYGPCSGFEAFTCPPSCLTNVGGALYFQAEDDGSGREPWRSDGTPEGTILLKNINPGACVVDGTGLDHCSSNPCGFREGQEEGEVLFSAAADELHYEIWTTDGTPAGTVLAPAPTPTPLRESSPTPTATGPHPLPGPGHSAVLNGVVIFGYDELYKSDGSGGAVLLKIINNTPASSYPDFLASVGETLFFFAVDGIHGNELWRSNGTAGDAVLVKDINAGPAGSLAAYPAPTVLDDTLFFVANDGVHGNELWRSDGSGTGTSLVKDIDPGPANGLADLYSYSGRELSVLNDTLFFAGRDAEGGFELWRSDGTADGTLRVKDIDPGPASSNPSQFVAAGGLLFFVTDEGIHGRELWRTDGSEEGTQLVKDIAPGAYGSGPSGLAAMAGQLYFFSQDTSATDAAPAALWKSDGTAAGTVIVKGIPASPAALLAIDRTLFFLESDQYGERRVLWRSDGTNAGTVSLKSATPPGENFIGFVSAATDILYFGIASPSGNELWKTDGTEVGTVLVKRFDTPTVDALWPLASVGDSLIFSVDHGDGLTLWKSDGTADGTAPLPDTSPALRFDLHASGAVAGSRFYLAANDGVSGTEPWALVLSGFAPTPTPTVTPTSVCGDVCDGRACIVPGSGAAGNCVSGVDRCVCLGEVAPTLTPSPTPSVTPSATAAPPACVGDCDSDGEVTVDELVRGVDIALDALSPQDCAAMSCRGFSAVTVDCLVEAVDAALNGCPATPSPSPTPMTKLPSPTPTVE